MDYPSIVQPRSSFKPPSPQINYATKWPRPQLNHRNIKVAAPIFRYKITPILVNAASHLSTSKLGLNWRRARVAPDCVKCSLSFFAIHIFSQPCSLNIVRQLQVDWSIHILIHIAVGLWVTAQQKYEMDGEHAPPTPLAKLIIQGLNSSIQYEWHNL